MPYRHYQLVLSWYLHQPESHQLSLQKVTQFVSLFETLEPIDRTPGTPGSDKKSGKCERFLFGNMWDILKIFHKSKKEVRHFKDLFFEEWEMLNNLFVKM